MARNTRTTDAASRVAAVMALAHDEPTQDVPVATNGHAIAKPADDPPIGADFFTRSIKIAERLHTCRFENETEAEVMSQLLAAQRQTDASEPVDLAVVRKLRVLAESWAIQRGLDGEGGEAGS